MTGAPRLQKCQYQPDGHKRSYEILGSTWLQPRLDSQKEISSIGKQYPMICHKKMTLLVDLSEVHNALYSPPPEGTDTVSTSLQGYSGSGCYSGCLEAQTCLGRHDVSRGKLPQLGIKQGAIPLVQQAPQAPCQAEDKHTLHVRCKKRWRQRLIAGGSGGFCSQGPLEQSQQCADLACCLVVHHRSQIRPAHMHNP